MSKCCDGKPVKVEATNPCCPPKVETCCGGKTSSESDSPEAWFGNMIGHCLDYATAQKDQGKPIVGIMCEYTPRELIMAAGAVPVCLCGGSASTIPVAEEHLPANLCPLIKSTFGYHISGSNPFIEMSDLIVAETTCDGKKKMFELMGESRDMYVLELPQKEKDEDAFRLWRAELDKLKTFLENRYGTEIDDAKIREAAKRMNRERLLRRRLAELMKSDCPPMTGRQLLDFKSSISGIAEDMAMYEKALEKFSSSPGPGAKGMPRVLMTGVPMAHGAEKVLDIIEDSGGLVVCMENCTGVKPIMEDVDETAPDIMDAVARKYFNLPCSVKTPNNERLELLGRLVKEYKADCVIELIWQACITYDVEAARVKKHVEQNLGLPYLRIETDYSPSDSARIGVRIEALFETIRER